VLVRGVVVSVTGQKNSPLVSITGQETTDHWLVWVRGVVVSVTGQETSNP